MFVINVSESSKIFFIPSSFSKSRIDLALSSLVPCSRSHIQMLIENKHIFCNECLVKHSKQKVFENDKITLIEPCSSEFLVPSTINLNIIFEDEFLLVIDKPAGMVVHPAPGHYGDTLANAVLSHCTHISTVGNPLRPGIVHRLDKDTSGLILVAKTNEVHAALSQQFRPFFAEQGKEKIIRRHYIALVYGSPASSKGIIQSYISRHRKDRKKMCVDPNKKGKIAVTHYELLKKWVSVRQNSCISLMKFHLLTGRTHQIRVHCQHSGYPIIGDPVYNKKTIKKDEWPENIRFFPRQALHASTLGFQHPMLQKFLEFESNFPEDMLNLIQTLESCSSSVAFKNNK